MSFFEPDRPRRPEDDDPFARPDHDHGAPDDHGHDRDPHPDHGTHDHRDGLGAGEAPVGGSLGGMDEAAGQGPGGDPGELDEDELVQAALGLRMGKYTPVTTLVAFGLVGVFVLQLMGSPIGREPHWGDLNWWGMICIGMPLSNGWYAGWGVERTAVLEGGEYWRLFASLAVQANILSVFFTFRTIRSAGRSYERIAGSLPTISLLLITSALGNLAFCFVNPAKLPTIGLFVSYFGFLGGLLGLALRYRAMLPRGFASQVFRGLVRGFLFILFLRFFFIAAATQKAPSLSEHLGPSLFAMADLFGAAIVGAVVAFILPAKAFVKNEGDGLGANIFAVLIVLIGAGLTFVPVANEAASQGWGGLMRPSVPLPEALTEQTLPKAKVSLLAGDAWQIDAGGAKATNGTYVFKPSGLFGGFYPLSVQYRPKGPFDAPDTLVRIHQRQMREEDGLSEVVILEERDFETAAFPARFTRVRCQASGRTIVIDLFVLVAEDKTYSLRFIHEEPIDRERVNEIERRILESFKELPE